MQTEILDAGSNPAAALARACAILEGGGTLAFPTETVYGLGAAADKPEALAAVFAAKGRDAGNPLSLHYARPEQIAPYVQDVPPLFSVLARAFLPGPLNCIVPRSPALPDIVTGGRAGVGLRMPAHTLALALLTRCAQPVAATSANRSGYPSPTEAAHVLADLGGRIDAILDGGPCPLGIESSVVDLMHAPPLILRPGTITQAELQAAGGLPFLAAAGAQQAAHNPAAALPHYRPRTPLHLFDNREAVQDYLAEHGAQRIMLLALPHVELAPPPNGSRVPLIAAGLYAALRRADMEGFAAVLVYTDEQVRHNPALMDRLKKAAGIA